MTEREAMMLWAKNDGKGKVLRVLNYNGLTDVTPRVDIECEYVPSKKEYTQVTIDKLFTLILAGKPVTMRRKGLDFAHDAWEPVSITEPVAWLLYNAKNLEFRTEVDA